MKEIRLVAGAGARDRVDRYLSEIAGIASRSQIQRLLKSGLVTIEGEKVKASRRLRPGEAIQVLVPEPEPSGLSADAIPLDIVYEDQFLLVVNKPAGMVVHPGAGVSRGTLVNALLAHCKDLSGIGGVLRPGIVHRLDKCTTGLVIVAKDDATHLKLSEDLAARKVGRTYEAVVWGKPAPKAGTIETMLGRSRADRKKMAVLRESGRKAITGYRVVEEFDFASRIEVNLKTGRTHQIRVHFAHIGHPVFGDPVYGGRRRAYRGVSISGMAEARRLLAGIDRQALHARELRFVHPAGGQEVRLTAPLPEDMQWLLRELRGASQGAAPGRHGCA